MKHSFFVPLMLSCLLGTGKSQTDSVCLYEHADFQGTRDCFQTNDPDLSDNTIGLHQASSVKVPDGVTVYLYEAKNYGGRFIVLYHDMANLSESQLGNDRVASIKIERSQSASRQSLEGVVLFSQTQFRGKQEVLFNSLENMKDGALGNDILTSLRISKGYKVTLYEDADYKGKVESFYRDVPDLGTTRIGSKSASSIQIESFEPTLADGAIRKPVVLYKDTKFQGLSEPFFKEDSDLGDNGIAGEVSPSFKRLLGVRVRSIQVPEGARVELFARPDFHGKNVVLIRDQWDLSQTRLGDSKIGSIKVFYSNEVGIKTREGDQVRLYTEPFFRGNMEWVKGDINSLKGHDVGNDRLMSVYVPKGFQVTLYEHADYKGRQETLNQSDPDLFDNPIGANTVSSLKVFKLVSAGIQGKLNPQLKVTVIGDLKAHFDAGAAEVEGDNIVRYDLDFDGDRKWDYSDKNAPDLAFQFIKGGTFTARLQVETQLGMSKTITVGYTIPGRESRVEPQPVVNTQPTVAHKPEPTSSQPSVVNSEQEKVSAYEAYQAAYKRMSQLMQEGKGDTPESKAAYEEYKRAKKRYEESLK